MFDYSFISSLTADKLPGLCKLPEAQEKRYKDIRPPGVAGFEVKQDHTRLPSRLSPCDNSSMLSFMKS